MLYMIRKEDLADQISDMIRTSELNDIRNKLSGINDPELIAMITRRLYDPGRAFDTKKNTEIVFSYYPSSNEYRNRFSVTAVISFINSMLDEWEPDVGDIISENHPDFVKLFDKYSKEVKEKMTIHNAEKKVNELLSKEPVNIDAVFEARAELIKAKQQFSECTPGEYKKLVREYKLHLMKHNIKSKEKDPFSHIKPVVYELNDDDVEHVKYLVMRDMGISETKETKSCNIKSYVADFLDEYFSYNPDNHVRAKYKPHYSDAFLNHIKNLDEPDRKDVCHRFREEKMKQFNRNLIPPEDTFVRFDRYLNANYSEIRQATDDIYPEYSVHKTIEDCIIIYDVIKGSTPDDLNEKKQAFIEKNEFRFVGRPLWTSFGKWTLVTPSSESYEKTDIGARNAFLKNLNTKYETDKKMGFDMMKKRIDKDKKKVGDNVPKEERVAIKGPCEDQGIKHIDDVERELYIDRDTIPIDLLPPKTQEERINVINIGAVKHANRFKKRIDINTWSVNCELEKPIGSLPELPPV